MEIRKTKILLLSAFWVSVVLAVAVAVAYETETLEPGMLIGDKSQEFVVATLMELLTIGLVPLALRLFRFAAIDRSLKAGGASSLARWGMVRLSMLAFPLVANTLLYYWFLSASFGYMAIILLLSMAVVYPGGDRCENEVKPNDGDKA